MLVAEKRDSVQKALVQRLGPVAATALDESSLAAHDMQYKKESEALKTLLASESARRKPDPVLIRGLTDLPGKPPQGRILKRGDYTKPGPSVLLACPRFWRRRDTGCPCHPRTDRRAAGWLWPAG